MDKNIGIDICNCSNFQLLDKREPGTSSGEHRTESEPTSPESIITPPAIDEDIPF
mgnify:CR=1 FL=1